MPRVPRKIKSPMQDRKAISEAVKESYEGSEDEEYGYSHWDQEFSRYNRTFEQWENKSDKLLEQYQSDDSNQTNPTSKFNIFFSVVQTLQPAIYARTPRPDVSRRFKDTDPAARVAATLLERCLQFEIDHHSDYKSALGHCVFDFLTVGRATAWLRYEPHIKARELTQPTDGDQVTEDIDAPEEELIAEESPVDYIHWRELGYTSSARTWEEVQAVWRMAFLNRKQLIARFGEEVGNRIPLDSIPDSRKQMINKRGDSTQTAKQALIYEVWCKSNKTVYWISKSIGKIIDKKKDPLGLAGFFPCPRPLFFSLINDCLVPKPMYLFIQDQCEACNILAERQRSLIEALKVRGVYNAEFPELQRLFSEGENNALIPVSDWSALAEKQGLGGAVDIMDISPISNTLVQSFEAMEQMKQQVYDLSGVSDVLRGGGTDPQETATAQTLKSVNGQNRLRTMQLAVVNFASELLNIKAQLICRQYSDETILNNGGAKQLSPQDQALLVQALAILRDEPARGFRIEVSADSLVLMDELQEKSDRLEFVSAVGSYFAQAIPMVGQTPELMPLAIELLKFSASAFKAGKVVEGLLDETADSFREQFEASKGQPKAPPIEIQKLQMEMQADAQKFQAEQQAKQMEMQARAAEEQAKMQLQMQAEQQRMQLELESKREEAQLDAETERQRQLFQAEQEKERLLLEDQRTQRELEVKTKLEQQKMLVERNTRLMELHYKNAGSISVEQIKAGITDGADDEARELQMAEATSLNPHQNAMDAMSAGSEQLAEMIEELYGNLNAPKELVRDPISGMAIGSEVKAPPSRGYQPRKEIAMVQQLPNSLPHIAMAQHALSGQGKIAELLMRLIADSKRGRKVVRGPNNEILGVE